MVTVELGRLGIFLLTGFFTRWLPDDVEVPVLDEPVLVDAVLGETVPGDAVLGKPVLGGVEDGTGVEVASDGMLPNVELLPGCVEGCCVDVACSGACG